MIFLSHFILLFITVINSVNCGNNDNNTINRQGECGVRLHRQCYSLLRLLHPQDARALCEREGGSLATVGSPEEEGAMLQLLEGSGAGAIMLGATLKPGEWRWTDGRLLNAQGCYLTRSSLTLNVTSNDVMTIASCGDICRQDGAYNVMAVKDVHQCYCSEGYEPLEYTPCKIDSFLWSNVNENAYFVYSLQAKDTLSPWDEGYPRGPLAEGACLSMNGAELGGRWRNERCLKKLRYICQDEGQYFVSSEEVTWFAARASCHRQGRRLADPNTADDRSHLAARLETEVVKSRFWIGGSNVRWEWEDGTPMIYTRWSRAGLNLIPGRDVIPVMTSSGWRTWTDVDLPLRAVCRKDRELTTPLQELTTPTQESRDDSAAALLRMKKTYIGVGVSSLMIIIIIVIIMFIICRNRRRPARTVTETARGFQFENKIYVHGSDTIVPGSSSNSAFSLNPPHPPVTRSPPFPTETNTYDAITTMYDVPPRPLPVLPDLVIEPAKQSREPAMSNADSDWEPVNPIPFLSRTPPPDDVIYANPWAEDEFLHVGVQNDNLSSDEDDGEYDYVIPHVIKTKESRDS